MSIRVPPDFGTNAGFFASGCPLVGPLGVRDRTPPLYVGAAFVLGPPSYVGAAFRRPSQTDSHTTIDVPAFERRPRIDGPATVEFSRRSKKGIPVRLHDARQGCAGDEQTKAPKLLCREQSNDQVRCADRTIGIRLERLARSV